MNLKFKYALIYLGIPFLTGLFFINVFIINQHNGGGPTTTLSHTNDVVNSYAACSEGYNETRSVGVLSNGGWEVIVTTDSPWIHIVSGRTGQGDGFVQYQAEQNFNPHSRFGIIQIGGQEFILNQEGDEGGGSCPIQVNQSQYRASSHGDAAEFRIDDWGQDRDWRVIIRDAPWLQFNTNGGRGSGAAVLAVYENADSRSRMTVVKVADKTIPIIQGGVSLEH